MKKTTHKPDILIIGGGPAGSIAAVVALDKEPNLNVIIIDKCDPAPHHVGEILLTNTMMDMERLGLAEEFKTIADKYKWGRKFGFAFVHGKERTPWIIANNHPFVVDEDRDYPKTFITDDGYWYTYMMPRHEFDESLRQMAIKRGAKLIEATAKEMRMAGKDHNSHIISITAKTKKDEQINFRPLQIIDASGQYAFISRKMKTRKKLGLRPLSSRYAYFKDLDFKSAEKAGFYKEGTNIMSYGQGWSWIARLREGLVSVGLVSDEWEGGFFNRIMELPEAKLFGIDKAELLDYKGNPAPKDTHYTHPDYSYESSVPYGNNWLAVGDAARFLDPLLSQGVTLAIYFGAYAAKLTTDVITGKAKDTPQNLYKMMHDEYAAELAILRHVVSLWYKPEEERCPEDWLASAQKIGRIFGREVKDDTASFRWIANLENVHMMQNGLTEKDIITRLENWNKSK